MFNPFKKVISYLRERAGGSVNPSGMEMYQYGQYEMGYSKSDELTKEMRGWVFAAVSAIADQLAEIDVRLYREKKGETEEVVESPVLDILYKVNPFTTKFDHFWLTAAFLEMTGEAFWFLEKDASGVNGIYFLEPSRMTPIASKEKIISGYRYNSGQGKMIDIPADQIIFLKYPNPAKPFRGLGTLEAAARTVDVDNYAETWNLNFFKNSARPDMVLTVDQPQMTKEQKEVLKHSIREQYEGVEKAHKLMVLFGSMKVDPVFANRKDMDFLEQQKYNRDKILGLFRVPKAVIAQTDEVNYACHSEDTEVLTESGFKKYWEVKSGERIATVSQETNKIEYNVPVEKFVYDYDGEMVHIKTENVDALVTPNHKVWYRTPKTENYRFGEIGKIDDITIKTKASFDYDYSGIEELNEFVIPKVEKKLMANNKTLSDEVKVDGNIFLEYLGYFLSEGGLLKETSPNFRYVHTICQKKSEENISKIRKCMEKIGFSCTEYELENGAVYWNVYGKAVNSWLRENCGDGCDMKRIPGQFKNLNKKQLGILFDALMLGDGSWDNRENRNSGSYSTTSKQLADDVQEIALKLGYSVSQRTCHDSRPNRKTLYIVQISQRKENNLRNYKRSVNYSGKVWCFEVPNHLFITRRNGKISAYGNSAKTAQYAFAKWTIKPKMERIIQQLNEFFVPLFPNSDGLYLDFQNPVPEDEEAKVNLYSKAINSWLTINEVRDMEGYPPIENGDEMYLPLMLAPIGGVEGKGLDRRMVSIGKVKGKKKNFILSERLKQLMARNLKNKKPGKAVRDEIKGKIKKMLADMVMEGKAGDDGSGQWTQAKKDAFWTAKDRTSQSYIKPVRDKEKEVFKQERKEILDEFGGMTKDVQTKKIDISKLQLDKNKEATRTIAIVLPVLEDLFENSANETFEFLGVDMEINVSATAVQALLKAECRRFAKEVTDTTNEAIKSEVAEGIRLDESIPQIKDRISGVFDKAEAYRAERVSRTETVRYNSAATQESFKESDVVEAKEWLVEPDACFVAGSKILKYEDEKIKSVGIDTLNLGDKVIGSSGKPQKVLAIKSKFYKGNIVHGAGFAVTPEHKFLTADGNWRAIGEYAVQANLGSVLNFFVGKAKNVVAAFQKIFSLSSIFRSHFGLGMPVYSIAENNQIPFFDEKIGNPSIVKRNLLLKRDAVVFKQFGHSNFDISSSPDVLKGDDIAVHGAVVGFKPRGCVNPAGIFKKGFSASIAGNFNLGFVVRIVNSFRNKAVMFAGTKTGAESLSSVSCLPPFTLKDFFAPFAAYRGKFRNERLLPFGDTLAFSATKRRISFNVSWKYFAGFIAYFAMNIFRFHKPIITHLVQLTNSYKGYVYDIEVENDHSFVLASGLVAHNCEFCAPMAGKIVKLDDSFFDKGDTASGREGGTLNLDYDTTEYPPLHANSYHKDTEAYTRDGFKFIKDIKIGEEILSLNPKTFDLEWVKVKNLVSHKQDKLISFKSRNFDLAVTPEHQMFYQKRWDRRMGRDNFGFVEARKIPPEAILYRSSKWHGKDIRDITIGRYKIPSDLFCRLMGWYLSEGSVVKRKGNSYQISFSQKKYIEEMHSDLIGLPMKINRHSNGLMFNDSDFGKYLMRFGKSFEKFVPEDIKSMGPENIRIFLDAFLMGDGSTRTAKKWKGGNLRNSLHYFTASKRMADDLGELILKVGRHPSYRLQKNKGKAVRHKNGIYVGNYDIWVVGECYSQKAFLANIKIDEVDYNDDVYCVELEKYHTLYIRKNGKCVWCGNCRCSIGPVFIK